MRPAKTRIRVFAVCMEKAWVFSYPLSAQQRLWSDWEDAQADLDLRWAHNPLCTFCHEAAQMSNLRIPHKTSMFDSVFLFSETMNKLILLALLVPLVLAFVDGVWGSRECRKIRRGRRRDQCLDRPPFDSAGRGRCARTSGQCRAYGSHCRCVVIGRQLLGEGDPTYRSGGIGQHYIAFKKR